MKDVSVTEFKQMKVPEIKEGGSFNLVADGEFLAVVVIPISADKKSQFQSLAGQMNAAIGK